MSFHTIAVGPWNVMFCLYLGIATFSLKQANTIKVQKLQGKYLEKIIVVIVFSHEFS
jgi:hypothetical protein